MDSVKAVALNVIKIKNGPFLEPILSRDCAKSHWIWDFFSLNLVCCVFVWNYVILNSTPSLLSDVGQCFDGDLRHCDSNAQRRNQRSRFLPRAWGQDDHFFLFNELSSSKLKVGSTLSDTWCICRVIQVETADFKIQKGRSRTRRGSSENVLEVHL